MPKKGEQMPITIAAEKGALTQAEQQRLEQVSARLPRYFNNIVSIEWCLSIDGGDRVAACNVHSKSGFNRVQVGSDAFGESIDQALDKIVRQRRRRKAISQSARRHAE
jgi:ribosome-associated translation inhibitor RaiA